MPRYYFHIRNDMHVDDEEGVELPDLIAARERARIAVCDLVCESIRNGHLNLDHFISVADDDGIEVLKLRFRDAFALEGSLDAS